MTPNKDLRKTAKRLIKQAKKHLQRPFIWVTADTVITDKLPPVEYNWLGLYPTSIPELYSTAKVKDGLITDFTDKSKDGYQNAFIGLAGVYDYSTFWDSVRDDEIVGAYYDISKYFEVKEHQFDWHLSTIVSTDGVPGNMQLCHTFHNMHQHKPNTFGIVVPMIRKINPVAIMRIKANLSLATKEVEEGRLHIDMVDDDTPDCVRTSILYMNSNDGYTVFEDGTKVESVMNRSVSYTHLRAHET